MGAVKAIIRNGYEIALPADILEQLGIDPNDDFLALVDENKMIVDRWTFTERTPQDEEG